MTILLKTTPLSLKISFFLNTSILSFCYIQNSSIKQAALYRLDCRGENPITTIETAKNRKLPLQVIKLKTMEEAQSAPSPAIIFSLFYNGKFMTTDISVCMNTRYDKIMCKLLK